MGKVAPDRTTNVVMKGKDLSSRDIAWHDAIAIRAKQNSCPGEKAFTDFGSNHSFTWSSLKRWTRKVQYLSQTDAFLQL